MMLPPLWLLLSLACQSEQPADSGDTELLPVDFTTEVQAVLDRNCVSCHAEGSDNTAAEPLQMSLEASRSYEDLVGVSSSQLPSMLRVTPGDPEASYLWLKLQSTHLNAGGQGDGMPPGFMLAPNDLEPIERWIAEGAAP